MDYKIILIQTNFLKYKKIFFLLNSTNLKNIYINIQKWAKNNKWKIKQVYQKNRNKI